MAHLVETELWRALARRFLPPDQPLGQLAAASGGFSGATVVRVETSSQAYALRGWPAASSPARARILELHRFLAWLADGGIPVAPPLSLDSGETLTFAGGRFWQCEPWLPGAPRRGDELTIRQVESLMGLVARLHRLAEGYAPGSAGGEGFRPGRGRCPAVGERRAHLADWTGSRILACRQSLNAAPREFQQPVALLLSGLIQHGPRIAAELARLEYETAPLHPCFRDLWRAHVLWSGEEVSGLIDAAAARTDHAGTDLSRLLGSLFADDRSAWRAALDAYCRVRPLTPLDEQLIRVLDRSGVLLSGLTWASRWQAGGISKAQLPAVVARLEELAGRVACLDQS